MARSSLDWQIYCLYRHFRFGVRSVDNVSTRGRPSILRYTQDCRNEDGYSVGLRGPRISLGNSDSSGVVRYIEGRLHWVSSLQWSCAAGWSELSFYCRFGLKSIRGLLPEHKWYEPPHNTRKVVQYLLQISWIATVGIAAVSAFLEPHRLTKFLITNESNVATSAWPACGRAGQAITTLSSLLEQAICPWS